MWVQVIRDKGSCPMTSIIRKVPKPLGLVWVEGPRSVVVTGLVRALEEQATVHFGSRRPEGASCIVLCSNELEDLSERMKRLRESNSQTPPIVVFGTHLNLPLARDALRAGASGFVHAGMTPDQLLRAVAVATKGELVAPRELLGYLLDQDEPSTSTTFPLARWRSWDTLPRG